MNDSNIKIGKIAGLRLGFAILSSGVFAFLSQIAVFIFTRSKGAEIPAGEIIGLTPTTSSVVLGLLWLAIIILLTVAQVIFGATKRRSIGKYFLHIINQPKPVTSSSLLLAGIPILFAVILCFYSPLTGYILRTLGYGGGQDVLVYSEIDGSEILNCELENIEGPCNPHRANLILLTDKYGYVVISGSRTLYRLQRGSIQLTTSYKQ